MIIRPRSARGEPLRFLVLLFVLWIAGRLLAYGLPQAWLKTADQTALASPSPDENFTGTAAIKPVFADAVLATASRPVTRQAVDAAANAATWPALQRSGVISLRPQLLFPQRYSLSPGLAPLLPEALPPLASYTAALVFDLEDIKPPADNPSKIIAAERLSLDVWGFGRPGGGVGAIVGQGQYGGSQAGAILRYMLGDGQVSAPMLFARATRSFSGPPQADIAFGASARPAADIPIRIAAEQRLALDDNGFSRPSLYAVTEIARLPLPRGASLDVYGQAGAIGVSNPAYFFDLQLVAQKQVARNRGGTLSLGAGLWSGGQGPIGDDNGASGVSAVARVDIGPRAAINFSIDEQTVHIAVDWRQRIAGNAAPGSGPAVTLSTRF